MSQFISWALERKPLILITASAIVVIGTFSLALSAKNPVTQKENMYASAVSGIEVATVGATNSSDTSIISSWPAELVSLGNISVQPPREGTIASWNVHVGQYVSAGQSLGMLSRPPSTPDVIATLAEKSKELDEMRVHKDSTLKYARERIQQLTQLRKTLEASAKQKMTLLNGASSSTTSLVESKKTQARAILKAAVVKTYVLMSGNSSIPTTHERFILKYPIGIQTPSARNNFATIFLAVMSDLNDRSAFPSESGLAYFEAASALANASIPSEPSLTDVDLTTLRDTLAIEQSAFANVLGEIKNAELESVSIQKETIEKITDIEADILGLQKEIADNEGEFNAAREAYQTLNASVNGGYAIIAPRSGTISSIVKRPGEFVGPGMPVATIDGEDGERFVRMRIPSNIQKPKVGAIFSVSRPGFPSDAGSARLIGIGSSLDEMGSYMADAILLDHFEWPVGASMRVIADSLQDALRIKLTSVWRNQSGEPWVWMVSEAGRVYGKQVVLGRTLGSEVEIYEGLKIGDRYIVEPSPEIKEDVLIDTVNVPTTDAKDVQTYEQMMRAMGM